MRTKHLIHFFLISLAVSPVIVHAQSGSKDLREANKLYKEKKFDQSLQAYNKALQAAPNNSTVNYNTGNANFRNNKFENAVSDYENTVSNTNDNKLKQNAYYNKGVSFSKQKKLAESIDAYKDALKLNGDDKEARENLQKALMEQKQQQQQQQQQQNKQDNKKDDKKEQDKKQDQKQDQQQQPKEQQSKLNKQQVEQLLQALQQKEKEVQKKMQQKDASPTQPDKDW